MIICRTHNTHYFYRTALLFVLIFVFKIHKGHAQGDLMIYPKRIVFDDHQKFQKLYITNTGKDTTRYTVSSVNMKMGSDGGFHMMDGEEPGHRFAEKYYRFFPREIKLGPNESQTVKLQLVRTNGLESGEYRSHLYFRHQPKRDIINEKPIESETKDVAIRLVPIYGLTIPVIVRKGSLNAKVAVSRFSMERDKSKGPMASMELSRSGNRSVYGDIEITHISPNHDVTPVGKIKGLAIYTPNDERSIQLRLKEDPEVDYGRGTIRITYKEGDRRYVDKVYKL